MGWTNVSQDPYDRFNRMLLQTTARKPQSRPTSSYRPANSSATTAVRDKPPNQPPPAATVTCSAPPPQPPPPPHQMPPQTTPKTANSSATIEVRDWQQNQPSSSPTSPPPSQIPLQTTPRTSQTTNPAPRPVINVQPHPSKDAQFVARSTAPDLKPNAAAVVTNAPKTRACCLL